ncbi:MAG: hypothetical protein HYV09_01630 [Deltaproteobacteria bacterium]|nr:hypothetical protein [Deltaproteobacteria bacterium]
MIHRRPLLFTACGLLTALAARRVHALSDPSELSVGGSTGAHDAHITCGPDVRVRHASGGVHYERVFEDQPGSDRGMSLDVRAGVGSTTITGVSDYGTDQTATALANNERDRTRVLATGQVLAGWDWRTFALRGGLGYFGLSTLSDDNRRFETKYYPLPALDMRIGRRSGFRGNLGAGAPPIVGMTRWYSLYGLAAYRFKEGGEVGTGLIASFGGTLDQRVGWVFQGSVPITEWMHVGGFGMIDADDKSKLSGFNWTAGAGVRFLLDSAD